MIMLSVGRQRDVEEVRLQHSPESECVGGQQTDKLWKDNENLAATKKSYTKEIKKQEKSETKFQKCSNNLQEGRKRNKNEKTNNEVCTMPK